MPDLVALCPVFLTVNEQGRDKPAGTGFFIGVNTETRPDVTHGYLVTARHCIEKAKKYGPLFVRINRRVNPSGPTKGLTHAEVLAQAGDAALIEIPYSEWVYHENEVNDVAVLPMSPPADEFMFMVTTRQSMATADVIESERIGIGDDLMIVGLFTSHHGRTKNRPIVRAGIIAAMPEEPLEDRDSGELFDAYLAEVRSVGGLSGSPVWLVINPARVKPGSSEHELRLHFYLLGLVRGHWQKSEDWLSDFGHTEGEALNTGIAMVTPIQKVLDIIDSEELMKERRRVEREEVPQEGNQVADSDLAGETEASDYDRFENLARTVVNVSKKEIDEKRKDET